MELSRIPFVSFLAKKGLVSDPVQVKVRELGGGVSNIVLLAESPEGRWVAKQSLGKLRVQDDWRSNPERILREAAAIEQLQPVLDGSVPCVVHLDRENHIYIMTAAPEGSVTWKELLLGGKVDLAIAREAGRLLARMITASQSDPRFKTEFEDRTVFDELRVDPYYRTTAARNPDVREPIDRLISDSWQIRTSLVHGDYSPKNMLVSGEGIFVIDFEVVHWGDPAFDSAFLLNHLMLKSFHRPQGADAYFAAAHEFWRALIECAGHAAGDQFKSMTVRHLGALMLARIDGKSPVEYIQDDATKTCVRRAAKTILLRQPQSLAAAWQVIRTEIAFS